MIKRLLARPYALALIAICLLSLGLRLWRLDFGQELPYLAHTDEPTQYNPAVRMIQTGDLNPHFFNYPSLTIYLHALVLYAGFWVGRLLGLFDSLAGLQPIRTVEMAVGVVGTPALLLLGRATTAIVGTLTVGLVYAMTRALARARWVPVWAALLLALSMPHIRLSHYMTVDVIATFFAAVAVMGCTLALARRERRWLWLGAVCGGLATASKYNYAVLALPVGLACLLSAPADLEKQFKRLMLAGLLFGLAFVVTSPYVLLDFETAYEKGILQEIEHYRGGHLGVTGSSFVWYADYLWRANPFYLLLGLPGLVLAWRRVRAAVPLVTTVILYYLIIGMQAVHFDRNVLPVLVLLIPAAAVTVDVLAGLAAAGWPRQTAGPAPESDNPGVLERVRPNRVHLWPVGVLMFVVPLLPSLWALPPLLQPPAPSGKAMAQAWFDQALQTPAGVRYLGGRRLKVAAESYTVYLDPKRYDVDYYSTITEVEMGLVGLQVLDYDIVILGSGMFARFYEYPEVYTAQVQMYDAFWKLPDYLSFESGYDPLEFREGGGQVVVFFLSEQAKTFYQDLSGG